MSGRVEMWIARMEVLCDPLADAAGAGEYLLFLFPDPWPKDRHHDHRLFNGALWICCIDR